MILIVRTLVGMLIIMMSMIIGSAARSQLATFDAANYAENLLQATRALQQINNQIQMMQNQVRMLENMTKNLERMEYASPNSISDALHQITGLMHRAQGIAFNVSATDQEFARLYPKQYAATITSNQLAIDARQRWNHSMDSLRDTMLVQSQVVQSFDQDSSEIETLVAQSQAAVGNLQATQATNQLLALSTKQQLQAQQLMAAQGRADALEKARTAMSEEQARAQFQRFLGDRPAYTATK